MKRRVLAVVEDIFFAAKIRAAAESLGVEFDRARTAAAAFEKAKASEPSIVFVDLHAAAADPFALAARLKADPQLRGVPLVGFYSHVQTELRDRARQSGFDHVLTRSAFTTGLPSLLQRD